LGFEVISWTEQSQQRCPPEAAYDCDEAGSELQAREDGELIVALIG
jgi:hypothetical protein